ncbi:MAG: DUF433 domain-containing protein [Candidatus Wallbacteria bacterium]|nr:DUF433 domain-containing protein [Candidatus Wallbacteria bacterium]
MAASLLYFRVMDYPVLPPNPYIEIRAPDDVRIAGTRMPLETVVEEFQNGCEADDIAREFPGLSLESVYGVIAYYLGHRESVERYVALTRQRDLEQEKAHDQLPEPSILARIRARRAAKQSA